MCIFVCVWFSPFVHSTLYLLFFVWYFASAWIKSHKFFIWKSECDIRCSHDRVLMWYFPGGKIKKRSSTTTPYDGRTRNGQDCLYQKNLTRFWLACSVTVSGLFLLLRRCSPSIDLHFIETENDAFYFYQPINTSSDTDICRKNRLHNSIIMSSCTQQHQRVLCIQCCSILKPKQKNWITIVTILHFAICTVHCSCVLCSLFAKCCFIFWCVCSSLFCFCFASRVPQKLKTIYAYMRCKCIYDLGWNASSECRVHAESSSKKIPSRTFLSLEMNASEKLKLHAQCTHADPKQSSNKQSLLTFPVSLCRCTHKPAHTRQSLHNLIEYVSLCLYDSGFFPLPLHHSLTRCPHTKCVRCIQCVCVCVHKILHNFTCS